MMHELFILLTKVAAVLVVLALATVIVISSHALAEPSGTLARTVSLPLFWTGDR